tara:strand:- start:412 stop:738 length:327 start_codon:yes stop_codon:yes gene_type:complete
MKLTKNQQMAVLKALSPSKKAQIKKHCQSCEMKGQGLLSILKSVGKFLLPVVKTIGMPVLKEFILPFLRNKAGLGLKPSGGGLRLAGRTPRRNASHARPRKKNKSFMI